MTTCEEEEESYCQVGEHWVNPTDMWYKFADCKNCCSHKDYVENMDFIWEPPITSFQAICRRWLVRDQIRQYKNGLPLMALMGWPEEDRFAFIDMS